MRRQAGHLRRSTGDLARLLPRHRPLKVGFRELAMLELGHPLMEYPCRR